jgi:hypothetical protein
MHEVKLLRQRTSGTQAHRWLESKPLQARTFSAHKAQNCTLWKAPPKRISHSPASLGPKRKARSGSSSAQTLTGSKVSQPSEARWLIQAASRLPSVIASGGPASHGAMPPLLQHGAWAGAAWAPAVAHQACACRAPAPRQEPCCNGQGSPGEPRAAQAARRSRRRGAGAARRGGGACAAEQGGSGILELVADRITVDVGGRQVRLGPSAPRAGPAEGALAAPIFCRGGGSGRRRAVTRGGAAARS